MPPSPPWRLSTQHRVAGGEGRGEEAMIQRFPNNKTADQNSFFRTVSFARVEFFPNDRRPFFLRLSGN